MVNVFKAREARTVRLNLRPTDWATLKVWADDCDRRVSELIADFVHDRIRQQQEDYERQIGVRR